MVSLEINLFGEFRVRRAEDPGRAPRVGSAEDSFAAETTAHAVRARFSRDEILEALWPGTPPEAAGRSLRVTRSACFDGRWSRTSGAAPTRAMSSSEDPGTCSIAGQTAGGRLGV